MPVDKKARGVEVLIPPGDEGGARDGDLVAAATSKPGRYGLPQGQVRERLGSLSSEKAVSLIAIHAHAIPHVFPPEVLAEAEAAKPVGLSGREDWRALPLVTIDPADAKDHDDAVHAAPDEDPDNPGGFVVTVAIADVAAYVRPGLGDGPRGARARQLGLFPGPGRADAAGAHLERPLLASPAGGPPGARGAHDHRRRRAQEAPPLPPGDDALGREAVLPAGPGGDRRTAGRRRRARCSTRCCARSGPPTRLSGRPGDVREPLDLDLPERKILLKPDGTVDRVLVPERLDAHRLIEEFMILANVAAAETLEKAGSPLIYRAHDEPSLEKMRALGEVLASIGIKLPKEGALKPALFNRILANVEGTEHQAFINEVVLRSQAQAEYSAENYGHFGLNLRRYAHFTSPIRRYADLIVHRALIRALKLGTDGLPANTSLDELAEIGARISVAERRAMAAERETVDRLIAHHLADRIGATFEGRISGVTRAGLFIKLAETGADGFVPAATIGADYYRYDEKRHAMIGDRTGETYRLGDRVEAKLVEAAPVAGALRFELVSEGQGKRPQHRGGARPAGRTQNRRTTPRLKSRREPAPRP